MTLFAGPTRALTSDCADDAIVVAASDTVADPSGPFYALYVGAAGNIKLTTLMGSDVLLTAVPIGVLKIGCIKVWATGTTAAATIVGLK